MDDWDSIGLPPAQPDAAPSDPWDTIGKLPGLQDIPVPVEAKSTFDNTWDQIGLPSPGETVDAGLPPPPPAEMPGIGGALMTGLQRAAKSGEQTSAAIHGGPLPNAEMSPEEQRLSEPVSWGDLADTAIFGLKTAADPLGTLGRTAFGSEKLPDFAPKMVYGAAQTAPEIAAGTGGLIVGGAAGGAAGGPVGMAAGGLGGAAIAAGAMNAVQTLGPTFAQELAKTPLDPDSAFDRAWDSAAQSGIISAVTWAGFGLMPFKGAVKNLLFQAAVVQPTIAVGAKATQNYMGDKPVFQDVLEGVPGAIGNTLIPGIAFHGMHLLGKNEAGLEVPDAPTAEQESMLTDTAKAYSESQNEFQRTTQETLAERPTQEQELSGALDELDRIHQRPTVVDSGQTSFPQVEGGGVALTPKGKFGDLVAGNSQDALTLTGPGPETIKIPPNAKPNDVVWRDPNDPTKFLTREDAEFRNKNAELFDPNRNSSMQSVKDQVRKDLQKEGAIPLTEADKYEAALTEQNLAGKPTLPQTLDSRMKERGIRVIEGGVPDKPQASLKGDSDIHYYDTRIKYLKKEFPHLTENLEYLRNQRNTQVLAERERLAQNQPKDTDMHESAIRVGKAILEIHKKMGIKAPLTIRFLSKIPERPQWFGYQQIFRDAIFQSKGQYRKAEPVRGVLEIGVDNHSSPLQLYGTMFHEFGHFIVNTKFADAPTHVKQAVLAAYKKWRRESPPSAALHQRLALRDNLTSIPDYISALQPRLEYDPKTRSTKFMEPLRFQDLEPSARKYWLNFEEFLAEQVAKWGTTSTAPRGIVEKWYRGMSSNLDYVWKSLTSRLGLSASLAFKPDADFGHWLDSLVTQQPYAHEVYRVMDEQTQAQSAASLRKAGEDPSLAVPQSENMAPIRASMDKFFGEGGVPPRVEAAAAHADRFNKGYKWMVGIQQLAKLNLKVEGLQRYREFTSMLVLIRDRIMGEVHGTLRDWGRLSEPQQDRLAMFIDDMMHMAYRSPEEAKAGVRRMPTPDEFKEFAGRWKLGPKEIKIFQDTAAHFKKHLERAQELMLEEPMKITDPKTRALEVASVKKQIADMAAAPYFPAMRHGNFWVDIRDDAGRRIAFHTFEKYREAKKFRESEMAKPGQVTTQGFLPEHSTPFSGMPPGLLKKMEERLDLSKEQREVLQKLKSEYAPAASFRHRLQRRMLVPGYSKDFRRAYANYFFHGANFYAKTKFKPLMEQEIQNVRDSWVKGGDRTKRQQIADFMQEHLNEVMNGKGDYAWARGLTFHYYLGVLPAKAVTNMTQTAIATYPHLASKFGDVRATTAILKAGADIHTFSKRGTLEGATTGVLRAMGELVREGVISEQMAVEVAAVSEGRNLTSGIAGNLRQKILYNAGVASGYLFGLSEQFNRRIAGRAAYELALAHPERPYVKQMVESNQLLYDKLTKQEGFSEAEAAAIVTAKDTIEITQGQYNREALPKLFWGKRRTVFAFQTFKQNMLFMMWHNKPAAARMMLIFAGMGGLMGIPGYDEAKGILKAIGWQFFGKDWDLDKEIRETITELMGGEQKVPFLKGPKGMDGKRVDVGASDLAMHGLSRYGFGLPTMLNMLGGTIGQEIPAPSVDMSRSFGLDPILPVDVGALFGPPTQDKGKVMESILKGGLGATFSIPVNWWDALRDLRERGLDLKLAEKGMPAALHSLSKAYRYYRDEGDRGPDGSRVLKFDARNEPEHMMEILATAMGFQITRASQQWDATIANASQRAMWNLRKEGLYQQLDAAVKGGDKKEIDSIIDNMTSYNKEAPQLKEFMITKEKIKTSLARRAASREKKESGGMLLPETQKLYPEMQIIDTQRVK